MTHPTPPNLCPIYCSRVPICLSVVLSLAITLISGFAAGETVNVAIGVLPPGKTVVITYTTTVETTLPIGDSTIGNQGKISFNEGLAVPTGDPDETAVGDPLDPTISPARREPMPPLAGLDTIWRLPSQNVGVEVSALLANDSSPDGSIPLEITAIGNPGGTGATATLINGIVIYEPNGYMAGDAFKYTVRDTNGLESTGTVLVRLLDPDTDFPILGGLNPLPDGDLRVTYFAFPGSSYLFQSSEDLILWRDSATVVADAQGRVVFVDPAPRPRTRFYRAISLP